MVNGDGFVEIVTQTGIGYINYPNYAQLGVSTQRALGDLEKTKQGEARLLLGWVTIRVVD